MDTGGVKWSAEKRFSSLVDAHTHSTLPSAADVIRPAPITTCNNPFRSLVPVQAFVYTLNDISVLTASPVSKLGGTPTL